MRTKIVVPIMPTSLGEVLKLDVADFLKADIIEWRADALLTVDKILNAAPLIVKKFVGKPLLFTLRTSHEGGQLEISDDDYCQLILEVAQQYEPDYLDVEYFSHVGVRQLLEKFSDKIVLSYHNFQEFPKNLSTKLQRMATEKVAVIKVAVNPQTKFEVLELMRLSCAFTNESKIPLVSVAMGTLGRVTRFSMNLTGSVWTFACLDQLPSAPGQLSLSETHTILDILEK